MLHTLGTGTRCLSPPPTNSWLVAEQNLRNQPRRNAGQHVVVTSLHPVLPPWRRRQAAGAPVVDDVTVVAVFLAQALAAAQVVTGAAAAVVVAVEFLAVVVAVRFAVAARAVVAVVALIVVALAVIGAVVAVVMVVTVAVAPLCERAAAGGNAQGDDGGSDQFGFHGELLGKRWDCGGTNSLDT